MTHIDYDTKTRAERTGHEWLSVGSGIAALANKWADRYDLVAFIGEGATGGHAPALYKPAIAEIEVNTDLAFGFGVSPNDIGDLAERSTQYEWAKATGAVLHEAFHARFSRWSLEKAHADLAADEFDAIMLLEEGRIEAQGLALDASNRVFLRACAMDLVLGDAFTIGDETLTVRSAAKLVGLIEARVVAGVLERHEVDEVLHVIRTYLGSDVFAELSSIAASFQAHNIHENIEPAYPLAKRWAEIVRNLADERGEEAESESSSGSPSGSGESAEAPSLSDLMDAIADAADAVEINNFTDLADQEEAEKWREEVDARRKSAREQKQHERTASEVFGTGTAPVFGASMSRLERERKPVGNERAAAVTVARLLEKAKYRDRDVTVVSSQVPGGRLRTRALVQAAAQKAAGQMPTAEPWRRKVRRQTDEPSLRIGVMVDISGSMGGAMEPMATTAWVMSEAARRVQARAAMVYYGNDVFPTLRPGQHLTDVQVYSAPDGTEKFDRAFQALDGALNLLHGDGARLLVVVSDGNYTDRESKAARDWLRRCESEGVAVLWLTFSPYKSNTYRDTGAVIVPGVLDPAAAAVVIGTAAARALEQTSARRAA